jgi:hypothetical protein
MSVKRVLVIVMVSALLLAVGIGPGAGHPACALPESSAEPTGATISYAGRLSLASPRDASQSDDAGQPVAEGSYAFTFTLYAAEIGGQPLWSEVQEGVPVQGGSFAVSLGSVTRIPPDVLDAQTLWLAVEVRGPGEAAFTALTPRQRLNAASPAAPSGPTADGACPHNHFMEDWTGDGGAEAYGLRVENTGWGDAIRGYSSNGTAVFGASAGGYGGSFLSSVAGGVGLKARGGSNSAADLVLGANNSDNDDGRLYSDPVYPGSDIFLVSNDAVQLELDNDNDESGNFWILNGANTTVFSVNENGDMTVIGNKSASVTTQDYGQRKLYAVESPEVWFEDFGSAQLVDGAATVAIEPVFAQTVNLTATYHVFLTPLGDCPLYIADKTPATFTVKAMGGQRCSIAFDYRLVAKRLGYEEARLEPADIGGEEEDD